MHHEGLIQLSDIPLSREVLPATATNIRVDGANIRLSYDINEPRLRGKGVRNGAQRRDRLGAADIVASIRSEDSEKGTPTPSVIYEPGSRYAEAVADKAAA